MCDYRAALRRSRRRLERSMTQASTTGRAPSECPRTPATRGSAFDYFWRSRDELVVSRFEQVRATLAADTRPSQSIKVVALGHTHLAAAPVPLTRGGVTPVVRELWSMAAHGDTVSDRRGDAGSRLVRRRRPASTPPRGSSGLLRRRLDRAVFRRSEAPRPILAVGWKMGHLPRDAAGMATACSGGGPAA